jgi:hypothetical protein
MPIPAVDPVTGNYVLEAGLSMNYLIIGPGMVPGGNDPNRLLVYVDPNDTITGVTYG